MLDKHVGSYQCSATLAVDPVAGPTFRQLSENMTFLGSIGRGNHCDGIDITVPLPLADYIYHPTFSLCYVLDDEESVTSMSKADSPFIHPKSRGCCFGFYILVS